MWQLYYCIQSVISSILYTCASFICYSSFLPTFHPILPMYVREQSIPSISYMYTPVSSISHLSLQWGWPESVWWCITGVMWTHSYVHLVLPKDLIHYHSEYVYMWHNCLSLCLFIIFILQLLLAFLVLTVFFNLPDGPRIDGQDLCMCSYILFFYLLQWKQPSSFLTIGILRNGILLSFTD